MEYVLIAVVVVPALLLGAIMLAQSGEPPARGAAAPAFDLPGTDGARHSPVDAKGRHTVLFFFPMDDTPECVEAVDRYREAQPRIEAAGGRLLAVAVATPEAAKAYAEARSIGYPVLADERGRAAKAWGTLVNFGFYRFSRKLAALVSPAGRIVATWPVGTGAGHVDEVVEWLESARD